MPRSLVSFWKRAAVSGLTADGREILPQELRDIAETYRASFYTAVIWCDHERWQGSHGTVFAVRLVEEADDLEPGEVALEVQLKPNDRLLYLNDQGQKLFTSIEITPNFRGSGKAYLTGLAVTDEPASVGTQELYFSKKTSKAAYYAASIELGPLAEPKAGAEESGLIAAMTSFFKRFASEVPAATTPQTPTESKPPMDEATAKALKALLEQLLLVAAGIQAVIEPATEEIVDDEENQELVDSVETAVADIVEQAEKDREFSRRKKEGKGLDARLANIEKMFSKALNTAQGRQVPRTAGAAEPAKKRVL